MSPLITPPPVSGHAGTIGEYVFEQYKGAYNQLKENCAVELQIENLNEHLFEILRNCNVSNWDGIDADPISYETILTAIELVQSLPPGVLLPKIEPVENGSIHFEWYQSPRKILTVELANEGYIYYAALLNNEKVTNKLPISTTLPNEVINLINDVMS